MKKILLVLTVFLLSCTSTQEPNTSKQPIKTSTKSKVIKKAPKQAPAKPEKKEEKMVVIDNKLGLDTVDNEDKEREEVEELLQDKHAYTWLDSIWNAFKVNRAEDLLKELDKGKVYRTKESILFVIKSEDLKEDLTGDLAKIYALQKGSITIYSNVNVKEKLTEKGLPQEKIQQRSRADGNTIIQLDIEVGK